MQVNDSGKSPSEEHMLDGDKTQTCLWKDADVGADSQEVWRRSPGDIYGCRERGHEVTWDERTGLDGGRL